MTLDQWISERGMSSAEFGLRVGLTQGYVSRLRRRIPNITLDVALAIRDYTKGEVTVDELQSIKGRIDEEPDEAA